MGTIIWEIDYWQFSCNRMEDMNFLPMIFVLTIPQLQDNLTHRIVKDNGNSYTLVTAARYQQEKLFY